MLPLLRSGLLIALRPSPALITPHCGSLSLSLSSLTPAMSPLRLLGQDEAVAVDQELFNE